MTQTLFNISDSIIVNTDINISSEDFIILIKTDNTSVSDSNQILLPIQGTDMVIDWGDGSVETVTQSNTPNNTIGGNNVVHTYPKAGNYIIKISKQLTRIFFNNGGDGLKLYEIMNWGDCVWTSFSNAFQGCQFLDVKATDTPDLSGVTNMSNMFNGCRRLINSNGSIGSWNVGNVTNMQSMFQNATAFNQDIGSWNVGNVTNMQSMFNNATAFNQNIGSWNVGGVTNMNSMFISAVAFNQDIGSWNVSNVTNMNVMFQNATAFNQDIGSWNVGGVTNFTNFMAGKGAANYSAANLDSIYNGWSQLNVQPNITITFNTIRYTAAGQAGKDILTGAPNNWSITDGGI
jgi:surface protein